MMEPNTKARRTQECFPIKFPKTVRPALLQNTSEQLLLKVVCNLPFDFSAGKCTDTLIRQKTSI